MEELLRIENLKAGFSTEEGYVAALRGLSLCINKSEIFALVGESGSGKTVTCMSILGLLPEGGEISGGSIYFAGKDLLKLSEKELLNVRGREIGMVFQEPLLALNPVFNIGNQIMETLIFHLRISKKEARNMTLELFFKTGLPQPAEVIFRYPHQLSGGMRQRAMIAQALACRPKILLADEPTSSLDVTIQVQILNLFKKLRQELGISILLVTHDLSIVSFIADRIAIIKDGRIIETGPRDDIFNNPQDPYTKNLIEASLI
ncbi:MAG: ABC transporter ATP-binding protein [Candidatus Omnitrophota bacterium]